MDSGRLIFDSSPRHGHMLVLGGSGTTPSIFRGARTSLLVGMEEGANRRLPFFTLPEDLLEEEYYDEQPLEKKRRLTPEQVQLLERSFEAENKLEPERKTELAKQLGMQPRQVAVWFQNRRARWKTKQLERDFDRLKAAYDSLLADHDSLLKDNDRLRSQVANLSEKLHGKELGAVVASGASSPHVNVSGGGGGSKVEDHLSTGSGGSAVVDGSVAAVDSCSGDSCYQLGQLEKEGGFGRDCMVGPVDGVHSEDDGSDDGCNYMPAGAVFEESHPAAENWWGVWN